MIKDIKELNFPSYATLSQATCTMQDMGERTISSQIKIDGNITPDFSEDWEIEFQGEKYIMPLRQPQGSKENTSLNSIIELTFEHWAIYQLKRYYFVTLQPLESGTAIADQYIASVSLNLVDFCALFAQILDYYYGDSITIDLNSEWESKIEPTSVEISYSYIWDVLLRLYELYAVRWQIESNTDTDHYVIKVGYPTTEIDHIFEYGFKGGLLKVERQVQDSNIRNMLLGRGGKQNLPYRYFKNIDQENSSFSADPDWIPELANIYFDALRGATFRSYVQGWKAKHYGGATTKDEAYASWAWEKGYTDNKFDPVEYVKDDDSIVKYGELFGGLNNNEDIYPTIQGVVVTPYGRIDEVVDVDQMTSDGDDSSSYPDITYTIKVGEPASIQLNGFERNKVYIAGNNFTVPQGRIANLLVNVTASPAAAIQIESYSIVVYDQWGNKRSASGITEGQYHCMIDANVYNKADFTVIATVTASDITVQESHDKSLEIPEGSFNIWVKDLWGTSKRDAETELEYVNRVWAPILGDSNKEEAKVVFSSGMLSTSQDYEFKIIKGGVHYDTRKQLPIRNATGQLTGQYYTSEWRLTLAKSDADLESTGMYVPSTHRQGKPGDHFFFIGIEMPHDYTVWAEQRLDDYKTDELYKVRDIKPTWVVNLDKIRISAKEDDDAQTIISQLKAGCSIRLSDKRFIGGSQQETLYVQSITYTYSEPTNNAASLIPNVEIVLSDEYEIVANPIATLQGEISAIQKQIGSVSNIEQIVRAVGDRKYLRKDSYDRTPYSIGVGGDLSVGYRITANEGAQFGPAFVPGITGIGGRIDGNGNGELDSLVLRRFLDVPELRYNRTDITVGDNWSAPGGGLIESVDTEKQLVTLKLAEGEIGAVRVGDICMGIFHMTDTSINSGADYDDGRGNRRFAGFATSYFQVIEILGDRYEQFRYALRPTSENYPIQIAPMASMTFVSYGSFTDPNRRTSRYDTRTYQRYLIGVDDWEFRAENIAAQFGNLGNLSIFGIEMVGYSAYLNNIYMSGVIQQFTPEGTPVPTIVDRGQWDPSATYSKNDDVWYANGRWRCLMDNTTEEPTTESEDWLLLEEGIKGDPGINGLDGCIVRVSEWNPDVEYHNDGNISGEYYMHIRFSSNSTGSPMSQKPQDGGYLGVYLSTSPVAPVNSEAYSWYPMTFALLMGASGGTMVNGRSPVFHFKYSNDGGKTFTNYSGREFGDWIGCYVDYNAGSSNNIDMYITWDHVNSFVGTLDTGEKGFRYIDIVTRSIDNVQYRFQCVKTHISSVDNAPIATTVTSEYWQSVNKMAPIYTPLLLADNAVISFMQGNKLLIMKEDGTTVAAGLIGGDVPLWVGSVSPSEAPFYVNINGHLYATEAVITGNSKFGGTLVAASGTFKSLQALDEDGNVAGSIKFREHHLWFEDADLQHQGTKDGRGLRFLSNTIWCRGDFGASSRTMITVPGVVSYWHANGATGNGIYKRLESSTYNGVEYHKVPCNGTADGDYSGMPIDIVAFNASGSTIRNYELVMYTSQRVLVINSGSVDVNIFLNGKLITWPAKSVCEVIKLGKFMVPAIDTSLPGNGMMYGAFSK